MFYSKHRKIAAIVTKNRRNGIIDDTLELVEGFEDQKFKNFN